MEDNTDALAALNRLAAYSYPMSLEGHGDSEADYIIVRDALAVRPADTPESGEAVNQWPFVESPGEFTERLSKAMREMPLLGAVRNVLIENPPQLYPHAKPADDDMRAGDSWVMVPREPTVKMLCEAAKHDYYSERDPTWRSLWKHMIDAAPTAPALVDAKPASDDDLLALCQTIVRDAVPVTDSGATCFVPRYQIDRLGVLLAGVDSGADDVRRYRWLREHFRFANDSLHEIWFDASLEPNDAGVPCDLDAALDALASTQEGSE